MRKITLLTLLINVIISLSAAPITISFSGNAYVTEGKEGAQITDNGVEDWKESSSVISSWFKVNKSGSLNLSLRVKSLSKESHINVTIQGDVYPLTLESSEWAIIPVANHILIERPGYVRVDLQGISKTDEYFAVVSDWIIDGSVVEEPLNYIHDFSTYWGRRGPSVHMKYTFPDEDVEYFYNEVTVPEGEDVVGSYFMVNGFGEGYCGIQVNSEKERRILFSVWSPFATDDPKVIPEDQRIKVLGKGKDVHIGEFGNEGSGGQSFLRYMWKAGVTYRFITRVRPDKKGNTEYTAYFFSPDENNWRMIASFLRPLTQTWYKNAHSFLENFNKEQGYIERKVYFSNQWVVTAKGKWAEITEGRFTYDNTARAKVRMDYSGGIDESKNSFFLHNCGFFDDNTPYGSLFHRTKTGKRPEVNLKKLK